MRIMILVIRISNLSFKLASECAYDSQKEILFHYKCQKKLQPTILCNFLCFGAFQRYIDTPQILKQSVTAVISNANTFTEFLGIKKKQHFN